MSKSLSISKFYKSFSGTDTIAFLMFPGINPIVIGSLTTVSYSMYRNKVPVINIGRTNINGITRGSRIYAGTMIFTLINKHWVRELQDQASYLSAYPTLKTDELPLFDIMVVSANEYGNSCVMFVYGVDFTDESQTLSVEDLFTENVFKFVAREVAVFDQVVIQSSETNKKYYTINSGIIKNFYTDEQQKQTQANLINVKDSNVRPLNRNLYYVSNGYPLMGNDVAGVQQLLNMFLEEKHRIPITYKFDRYTDEAVRKFQSTNGLIVDGVVDNNVYTKLLEYTKTGTDKEYAQVINKSGAFVRMSPDNNSSITNILPYLSSVEVLGKTTNNVETYYIVQDGYVSIYDCYDYKNNNSSFTEFKQLKYMDEDQQVVILQEMLSELYNNFTGYQTGLFDSKTEDYLKYFQTENNLVPNGICDSVTWEALINQTNPYQYKNFVSNHSVVKYTKEPDVYDIFDLNYLDNFSIEVKNKNTQQVKCSAIAKYGNNKTKTVSKTKTFFDSQICRPDEFINIFKDDPENLMPTDVYYTVYPYGDIPYKWHFIMRT